MWRLGLDTVGLGIVVVTLVALLFAVLMMQRQRRGKTIAVWLAAGILGVLLGSSLTLGGLRLSGFRNMDSLMASTIPVGMEAGPSASPTADGGGSSADAAGGGPRSGSPAGGGRGGMGIPSPARDLTALVRKMELLTGDISLKLSPAQVDSIVAALVDIEKAEKLSDEDAQAKHDAILAALDDAQKSQLDAIGLPRPARSGRGVPPSAPPANPFQDEQTGGSLQRLRARFTSASP